MSRDERINGNRRKLCDYLGELEWTIFNGDVEGDEEEEWTYRGEERDSYRLCYRECYTKRQENGLGR